VNSGAFFSILGTIILPVLALGIGFSGDAYASDPAALVAGGHRVSIHSQTGKVRFIGADSGRSHALPGGAGTPKTALDAASGFVREYGELFGLQHPNQELVLKRETALRNNREAVRFQQHYKGLPVVAAEIIVNLGAGNKLLSMSGEVSPSLAVSTSPSITPGQAQRKAIGSVAKNYLVDASALRAEKTKLVVYDPKLLIPSLRLPHLAWEMVVISDASLAIREYVLVDARSGAVSLSFSQVPNVKDRRTYTAWGTDTLPGTLVCTEADPFCTAGDMDAANAHLYAGDTYDFYLTHHGRDAIDNAGSPIVSTAH
jgi:Zn-dependent metalloprotease